MNYIPNKITEMVIDGIQVKEGQDNFYTFPSRGNHTVYILINVTNCTSLDSLFREVSNMTSIIFTSEFNTDNVENMNFMFYDCTSLVLLSFQILIQKILRYACYVS